jgi:hypothetical protein
MYVVSSTTIQRDRRRDQTAKMETPAEGVESDRVHIE